MYNEQCLIFKPPLSNADLRKQKITFIKSIYLEKD